MIDPSNLQLVEAIPIQVETLTKANQALASQNDALARTNNFLKIICLAFGIYLIFKILDLFADWSTPMHLPLPPVEKTPKSEKL